MSARILLVDDDTALTRLLAMRLGSEGFDVQCSDSPRAALSRADTWAPDLVVSDLCMDGMDGIRLFEALREKRPTLPVILMSAHGSIPDAVRATRLGVSAFVTKPFDGRILVEEIQRHLALAIPQSGAALPAWRQRILTRNPKMNAVLDRAGRGARSDANILITGPSGSGKEMLARGVHDASARAAMPFVAINCGAIPETLIESELFGHIKGAFTGAMRDSPGLFRAAQGGTVFLDEIGEMPLTMQVKLLRVLQERKMRPVGATLEMPVDARVVAATHRDLAQHMRNGSFREDLFYRLSVIQLDIPPLRERREDITVLAAGFLKQLAERYGQRLNGFTPESLAVLLAQDWPGNVRQLYNVVEQCVALADGPLITEALVGEALRSRQAAALPTLAEAREGFDRDYLLQALRMAGGSVSQAADHAGRNRTDFYRLLRKHGIEPDDFKDTQSGPSTAGADR